MSQNVPLSGAVIVSTPQDLALIDARKGLSMFQKVNVPVLGIIENMSYFIAPDTGARYEIFAHGGGSKAAGELGVPFLGEIPIVEGIRVGGDEGVPFVVSHAESEQATHIRQIARELAAQISILNMNGPSQPIQIVLGKDQ
jgi:ATP-binding protein involved in chromosome partitioning